MLRQLFKYSFLFLIFFYSCQSETDQIIEAHFKSLSVTGVGTLDECDPNSEVYDILFATSPIDIISDLDYLPKSKIAQAIVKIKKEKKIHEYINDMEDTFQEFYQDGNTVLELELLIYYLDHNRKNYANIEDDIFLINKAIANLENDDYQSLYYQTLLLIQKGERDLTSNSWEKALSIYFFDLGYIDEQQFLKSKIYLKLSHTILTLIDNNNEYERIIKHLDSLLRQYDHLPFANQMNKNYANEDSINLLYLAQGLAKDPFQLYSVNYNLAYYYEAIKPDIDSAKYYYRKTISVFENTPCNQYKFHPLLYYADYLKDPVEKKAILKKLEAYKDCDEHIRDNIDFVKLQYIDPSAFTDDVDSMVTLLLKERALAEKIYPGKSSLHLQDYYAVSCKNIHQNLAKKKGVYSKKDIGHIAKVFYDTRAKENYRLKNTSGKKKGEEAENIYARIESILRELNDFKEVRDFKDPIYTELYYLYEEQNLLEQNIESISRTIDELRITDLTKKCNSRQATIYNFISVMEDNSDSMYYSYSIADDDLSLFTIDKPLLDSLGNILLEKIKGQVDITKDLTVLRSMIFNNISVENIKEIIVVPDGIIGQLPLSIILNNDDVTLSQYPDLQHWVEQSEQSLSTDDVYLYSYSDEQTLKDKDIKIFTDLPYGIMECNEIKEVLNINKKQYKSGKELDKESILSATDTPWMHFSTHAFSNMGNRLDNFITVRDKEGKGKKLYSYELMMMAEPPEVVVLSACDAGVGMHLTGTGVFSVSKAFLAMGTDTVIKTLWKVNDAATKEFMVRFYNNCIAGNTISHALALSQKEMMSHTQYSHPYYWAGFVVEGNGEVSLKK